MDLGSRGQECPLLVQSSLSPLRPVRPFRVWGPKDLQIVPRGAIQVIFGDGQARLVYMLFCSALAKSHFLFCGFPAWFPPHINRFFGRSLFFFACSFFSFFQFSSYRFPSRS
jgi:hypothetical protein